jgi:hypothetical protein
MTLALVFSFALALVALLCLVLIIQPELWLRLWSPWQDLTSPRSAEKHISPAIIQYRALFGAIIFLCGAVLLPVALAEPAEPNSTIPAEPAAHPVRLAIPATCNPLDLTATLPPLPDEPEAHDELRLD